MDFAAFFDWAAPRLGLRAKGFRRVHKQVCKRVARRIAELRLGGFAEYQAYLEAQPHEWSVLDAACHVTISRFFRDGEVFQEFARDWLPALAERAVQRGERCLRIWCAACGAGEEPYSVRMLWQYALAEQFPALSLEIIATDADPHQLQRAREGVYRASSLREVPEDFGVRAFVRNTRDECVVVPDIKLGVEFQQQDLRREIPDGPFAAVFCRNSAFSYFDALSQFRVTHIIAERLVPTGILVVGLNESVPSGTPFEAVGSCLFRLTR